MHEQQTAALADDRIALWSSALQPMGGGSFVLKTSLFFHQLIFSLINAVASGDNF